MRHVLSSSLSSPITEEETRLAEQHYRQDHQERLSAADSETLQDSDAPVNQDGANEAPMRGLSEEEDLQLMLSMDLLLDVDVPNHDRASPDAIPPPE